ncbi:MAG: SusC/RagA family TonB-linked outer membrane protein [Thermoflavifilum sp.]|nr:SusC/RagA family TonB-linked outer membrane protein [Thermoflavifilum sp.]
MKKIYTRLSVLMYCIWFITNGLYAQSLKEISGKVVDGQGGNPMPGVTIRVEGSNIGVVTDDQGTFHIQAPTGSILVASYIGFIPKRIPIAGDASFYTIPLQRNQQVLNELVVTALGITKQEKQVGYAVQAISERVLTNAPDPNLINDLDGKVAGVYITNGGAGVGSTARIVIRGENSFSGTNQPLFVVDGVPINNETYFNDAIENSSNQGVWAEVDWGNGAAELNPFDIAKITVLKVGSAAALYGSRAANGAVVITTKTGEKSKNRLGVDVYSNTTWETPLKLPRLQNEYGAGNGKTPYRFVDGAQSFENNIPNFGAKFDPNLLVDQFDSPAGPYQAGDLYERSLHPEDTVTPTPWIGHADHFKKFLQTGMTINNGVSFSNASDHGSFRFSYGNLYNTGILPNTDLRRQTVAIRVNHQFNEHLSTETFFNFINSNSDNRPNIGYGSESVMYTFFGVYGMPINIDINSLKNKLWQVGQTNIQQFRYWKNHDNPYVTLYDNVNSFNKNRLIGYAMVKYAFNPHFSVFVRTGSDIYSDHREGHRAFSTVRFPSGGFRVDNVNYLENNTDFLANYLWDDKFSVFSVNVSAGGNRFLQDLSYTRDIANALITPGLYNFSNAQNQLPTEYLKFEKVIYSLYGFADLSYRNKIFLNLAARNDWSSTLPIHHNSYFYPSASLSVILSEMIQLPRWVSYLKLRMSSAQVGRDADPYSINNTFLTNTPFNNYPLTTANNVLANKNLIPSTTNSFEGGLETKLLDNRIGLDITIYNENTHNEVVKLPVPVSSGYTNAFINGASINNKGVEFIFSAAPFKAHTNQQFSWNMYVNFSHNVSTVTSLPSGINSYTYAQVTQYDRYYRAIQYTAKVGERLGNMYGNGFVRDPQGNIVYQNGVPLVTSTQDKLLGNYNPDFVLGWLNILQYRRFTFNFVWDWHQGGKFYSYTELGVLNGGMSVKTLPGRETGITGQGVMYDPTSGKYVPNNVHVDAATYYLGYYNANNNEVFMYNASYLKLRELRLSYTFPHIFGSKHGSSLDIALVGRNIIEFTQNKDVDPETLTLRGQQILPGIEFLSLPSTRSYGVSLHLSL